MRVWAVLQRCPCHSFLLYHDDFIRDRTRRALLTTPLTASCLALPLAAPCSLLTAYHPLPTTPYPPLTTHYALLTQAVNYPQIRRALAPVSSGSSTARRQAAVTRMRTGGMGRSLRTAALCLATGLPLTIFTTCYSLYLLSLVLTTYYTYSTYCTYYFPIKSRGLQRCEWRQGLA